MRRTPFCLALLVLAWYASVLRADALRGAVYLPAVTTQFRSDASVVYLDDLGRIDTSGVLSGTHRVSGAGMVFQASVYGAGQYSYILEGPAEPAACYDTSLEAVADPPGFFNSLEGSWSSDTRCAPLPPDPVPDPLQCGGGGPEQNCSPIVINFQAGYELTGADAPVWFDITGTGRPKLIGWTAVGSDEAFLWIDRNGNGAVDNGVELFGTASRLNNGQLAPNGFEALREFDVNADSVTDARDPIWSDLRLWRDANHNGLSEVEELSMLATSGVDAIEVGYHRSGRRDRHGNEFRFESRVWMNGASGRRVARPVYDIFFVGVSP